MYIKDFKIFIVGNPNPDLGGRYFIFVKLITNDNIAGIGEVYSLPFSPKTVEKICTDIIIRHVINEDPHQIEKIWRKIYSTGYNQRPDISVMGVLSAIEIALWDIIGKSANQPVYNLLGGKFHEKLRSYSYLYPEQADKNHVYDNPETAAQRAYEYVEQGFTAIKFDPFGPYTMNDPQQPTLLAMEKSEKFVKYIREAVSHKADLLFGTHGQLSPAGAIRLAQRLEPYEPLWFEEPTPPEMPEEMAHVAARTSIPIATGERLTTKYEFLRVMQCKAASILQMNLGRVGGLLEAKKIAGMAEAHYCHIAPHLYCGPIVGAANIQLSIASPNFLILESIKKWDGFHAALLEKPIIWQDGHVIAPTEPGLGVILNEDVALSHPYDFNDDKPIALHLDMTMHSWQSL